MGAAIRSLPAIWCSPASGAPSCAPAHSAVAPLRLRGLSAFRTMTLDQYGHLFGIGWSLWPAPWTRGAPLGWMMCTNCA